MSARSAWSPGLSQKESLPGNGSGGGPAADVDQDYRYESRNEYVGQGNCANICFWRTRVLAAEARKAGAASEVTRRIPRPPCLIGIEACNHWASERAEFVILVTATLRRLSNFSSAELSADGEQRIKCCTLGALKEARSRMRASCELIDASLSTALARSSQRCDHAESRTAPGNSGAPNSSASI